MKKTFRGRMFLTAYLCPACRKRVKVHYGEGYPTVRWGWLQDYEVIFEPPVREGSVADLECPHADKKPFPPPIL